ncbi:murein DD-endopeptidase / murein LD-carboxypeptidase [Methylophilaceae bacterium]|nr:murein DD-endopeptidase / murein LD-carboxypeptidase [Methylophilaceae bacterium]
MQIRFIMILSLLLLGGPVLAANNNGAEQPGNPGEQHSRSSWSDTVQDVLLNALSLTGIQYRYGGSSPETGFDCSGFVRYVFQQAANMSLPHNARAISQVGEVVSREHLQPGDLVFFNTMRSAFSHVGIYLGNNRFIHAPSSGGGVHVVNMNERYWAQRFDGARRIDTPPAQQQTRAR